MTSLKSLPKTVKNDTLHQYIIKSRDWALKDLTHLEQIPKAISIWRLLPQVSLTSTWLALSDGKLFTRELPDDYSRLLLIFELLLPNSCHFFVKNELFIISDMQKFAYFLARYPKKETVKTTYFLFELVRQQLKKEAKLTD